MSALQNVTNADAIANFVADASFDRLPKDVLEAARFCLSGLVRCGDRSDQ